MTWRNDGLQGVLEQRILKCSLEGQPRALGSRLAASPTSSAEAPPFFVIHGDSDTLVPVPEAREFVKALRAKCQRAGRLCGAARRAARVRDLPVRAHAAYGECRAPLPGLAGERLAPRAVRLGRSRRRLMERCRARAAAGAARARDRAGRQRRAERGAPDRAGIPRALRGRSERALRGAGTRGAGASAQRHSRRACAAICARSSERARAAGDWPEIVA